MESRSPTMSQAAYSHRLGALSPAKHVVRASGCNLIACSHCTIADVLPLAATFIIASASITCITPTMTIAIASILSITVTLL